METIGTITNIKVISIPLGNTTIDAAAITILETATGFSWLFYLWVSRDDAPPVTRVLDTQRLALAREAAFRKLPVHAFHDSTSDLVTQLQVEIP